MCCSIYPLRFSVIGVFRSSTAWQNHTYVINEIIANFESVLDHIRPLCLDKNIPRVTHYRIEQLEQDITTLWHSCLYAISTKWPRADYFAKIATELRISKVISEKVAKQEPDTLAEFTSVSHEARRNAWRLEKSKKHNVVYSTCAPRTDKHILFYC